MDPGEASKSMGISKVGQLIQWTLVGWGGTLHNNFVGLGELVIGQSNFSGFILCQVNFSHSIVTLLTFAWRRKVCSVA